MGGAVQNEILVLDKAFDFLKKIDGKSSGKVELGSLVILNNQDQEKYLFLVPESAGGISVEVDSKKVFTVSLESGLGRALINKAVGEKILFNDQEFEVVSVE